ARVTLTGESGVGKSTLMARFLSGLHARYPEAVILEGRCHAQDGIPYKALDGLMDALGRHLHRLTAPEVEAVLGADREVLATVFRVLRNAAALAPGPLAPIVAPDAAELRERLMLAVKGMLTRLATRSPLVLFIDDLHWGDTDSAAILAGVLTPRDAPALL